VTLSRSASSRGMSNVNVSFTCPGHHRGRGAACDVGFAACSGADLIRWRGLGVSGVREGELFGLIGAASAWSHRCDEERGWMTDPTR